MLCVAVLWSLTSDLDKMGKTAPPSIRRVCGGAAGVHERAVGQALVAQRSVGKATTAFGANLPLLFALAMLEMFTMSAYLKALIIHARQSLPRGAYLALGFGGRCSSRRAFAVAYRTWS